MTTFTNKELIKEIKERISSLEVRDDIERRAYEIALVSLEVEPDEREAYELFMEKRFGDLVDRRSEPPRESWRLNFLRKR